MTDSAIAQIEELLQARVGLRLDPQLKARSHRCIRESARAHGLIDLSAYYHLLISDADLFQALLDRITVQETGFFREPLHFDALCQRVAALDSRNVVIWSAGCANGQEPYSVAIALADAGLTGWRVVATDVSVPAVARARRGVYSEREIRGLAPAQRRRHLIPTGREWAIRPELKRQVIITHHNLLDPPPVPEQTCSIVMCRNVLIYFTTEQLRRVLKGFARALEPDGCLITASAESLWLATDLFRIERVGPILAYTPAHGGEGKAPPMFAVSDRPATPTSAPPRQAHPTVRQPDPQRTTERDVFPSVREALTRGEELLGQGDPGSAISSFRRAVYLYPDHALAHFYMGLALEATGADSDARRAFGAGLEALKSASSDNVETLLEGYTVEDLSRVLKFKLGV